MCVKDANEGMQVGVLQTAAAASPEALLLGKALQLGPHVGEGNPHKGAAAATALHAAVEERRGTPPHGGLGRPGRWQKPVLVEVGSRHLQAPVVALPNPEMEVNNTPTKYHGNSSLDPRPVVRPSNFPASLKQGASGGAHS